MSIRPLNLIGTTLTVAIGSSLFAPPRLCAQANPKQPTSYQQLKEVVPVSVPEFAVATVKSARGNGMSLLQLMPDGIRIENFSLQDILRAAFGMQDDRILGSPDWAKAERFDVEAKVDDSDVAKLGTLTIEQRRAMLLPLLVDRFDLKFHYEQRNLPTYNLVIAKGGSKLKECRTHATAFTAVW